jgi:hypothetical protein
MRILLAALLAAFAFTAAAQSAPRPRPPGTVPLEDTPPPPPMTKEAPELAPEITTRTEGDNQIQEYRVKGRLYMMRVTPRHGHPYILRDDQGTGTFTRFDNPLDNGVRVPQWVLMEF